MNNITIEEVKDILKCSIDETANMNEAIERTLQHIYLKGWNDAENSQVKIGQWIKHDTGHSIYYDCSLCSCAAPCTETADRILWKLSIYCPDCGAKMENGIGFII